MTEEEKRLVAIAQHGDDKAASEAIEKLRKEFDQSYGYCLDCDYLVVKESECCMNQVVEDDENIVF